MITRLGVARVLPGAVILLLSGVLVGCGLFYPPLDPGEPPKPFEYPLLNTPQSVLLNLKLAWQNRDSSRTQQLYDPDYTGTAPNPDPGFPTSFSYTRSDEVHVVGVLQNDPNVTGTFMELRAESTWVQLHNEGDPLEYTTIQLLKGVTLEVFTTSTTFEASTSFIEYTFKPYVTDTDTTWKIIRWTESF